MRMLTSVHTNEMFLTCKVEKYLKHAASKILIRGLWAILIFKYFGVNSENGWVL